MYSYFATLYLFLLLFTFVAVARRQERTVQIYNHFFLVYESTKDLTHKDQVDRVLGRPQTLNLEIVAPLERNPFYSKMPAPKRKQSPDLKPIQRLC